MGFNSGFKGLRSLTVRTPLVKKQTNKQTNKTKNKNKIENINIFVLILHVKAIVKEFSANGHKSLRIAYTCARNLARMIVSWVVFLQMWRCCCLVRWVIFAAYFPTLLYLCLSYGQAVAARIKANSTKKCIWRKNMVSPPTCSAELP